MDIAEEWIKRANCESDVYNKFISAYIALNFLYGGFNFEILSEQKKKLEERDKMSLYLMNLCQELSIDPFEPSDCVSEYLKHPVKDERPEHDAECSTQRGDCIALFKAIYQVRCNLFHGNKFLSNERDRKLVGEGAAVILKVLNAFYQKLKNS